MATLWDLTNRVRFGGRLPAPRRPLVVISYYDQRPVEPLIALLVQIDRVEAGAEFDVSIVVNATGPLSHDLEEIARTRQVLVRENAGWNIGAWQHGWMEDEGHDFFLFLQDECEIVGPGWLRAFMERSREPDVGLVGESETAMTSWTPIEDVFVEIRHEYLAFAEANGIPDRYDPTHLQATVLAARRSVLEQSGGFLTGDSRAAAVAGEIATGIRMLHGGRRNVQVAWLPYSYIAHPQWADYATLARRPRWSVARAARRLRWIILREPGRARRLRESGEVGPG